MAAWGTRPAGMSFMLGAAWRAAVAAAAAASALASAAAAAEIRAADLAERICRVLEDTEALQPERPPTLAA